MKIRIMRFDGIRGELFTKIEFIDNKLKSTAKVNKGVAEFNLFKIIDENNNICHIAFARVSRGYAIEIEFPEQDMVHNRLWLVEPYWGQFNYIEIENDNLKTKNIEFPYPELSSSLEMAALPDDLKLLDILLAEVIKQYQ